MSGALAHESTSQAILTLSPYEVGTGHVVVNGSRVLLSLGENPGSTYADAQLDDYHESGVLRWQPPLELKLRARFSLAQPLMKGTAGFGFWNDPLGMTKTTQAQAWWRTVRLPQALWFFFASEPSQLCFALNIAGNGWKAANLDASGLGARLLLPFAPFAMLACRWQWAYRRLWPLAEKVLKIAEAPVSLEIDQWHEYRIRWERNKISYWVDNHQLLTTLRSPRGPLGFVAWIDNQYMIATPQGRFGSGVVATKDQSVEIEQLEFMPL